VSASGNPPTASITIGPYSALVLSQTPDVPPQVTITPVNGAISIAWPSSYSEWVLFTRDSLMGNSAWVQVPSSQYQTNGSTISITVSPSGGNGFYRLQKM
jgi:hypothetical protein